MAAVVQQAGGGGQQPGAAAAGGLNAPAAAPAQQQQQGGGVVEAAAAAAGTGTHRPLIGRAGFTHISESLKKNGPDKTISDMQRAYGMAHPLCPPLLEFTDHLEVRGGLSGWCGRAGSRAGHV